MPADLDGDGHDGHGGDGGSDDLHRPGGHQRRS
jgi:hypothetical protein